MLDAKKLSHARSPAEGIRVAIQGELGSNSHMAALQLLAGFSSEVEVVPCAVSANVFERLAAGSADLAVLPIENSLYGAVAEHYDLLLANPVQVVSEGLLRIRFHLIVTPGVEFRELRHVLSHPVALAQCRRFLSAHPELEAVPFYDTAGSVKHLMSAGLRDAAAIAPELAAAQYGAVILERDLEDHAENFTRFQVVCRTANVPAGLNFPTPDKMSIAFSIEHRPGSLADALQLLAKVGVDLTRIESRPVPGRPWEYIFYVEFRFGNIALAEAVLIALRARCGMVKELGRYPGV